MALKLSRGEIFVANFIPTVNGVILGRCLKAQKVRCHRYEWQKKQAQLTNLKERKQPTLILVKITKVFEP